MFNVDGIDYVRPDHCDTDSMTCRLMFELIDDDVVPMGFYDYTGENRQQWDNPPTELELHRWVKFGMLDFCPCGCANWKNT